MMKKMQLPGLPINFVEEETEEFSLPGLLSEAEVHEAIQEAIDDLAADGLIVDTGERRYSPRTGRYEIVWAAVPDRKNKLQ